MRLFLLFFTLLSANTSAFYFEDNADDFLSLSLEELMHVQIKTGSLFSTTTKESSSAITVINREAIDNSGSKKLAHLIEQYVPGMIVMTHSEGEKIGLRGHIAAENYKLLLLVNGKNVTNMVYEGVITEIDQWDLGDIERVEVISGPGSVTYGTGAIAGVINIITKKANNNRPNWSVGLSHNNTYQSNGLNLQYSNNYDELGIYGFISYRKTDGLASPDYYRMNVNEPSSIRFVGKGQASTLGPQDYQADSFGRPQIKAHLNLDFGENFTAWLRYTQSGQTHGFAEQNYKTDDNGNNLQATNFRNIQTGSLIASADYRLEFANKSSLLTSLTVDSQEYIRGRPENTQYNPSHVNNVRQYAFAQNRARASFLYDFEPVDNFNIILGYEYSKIKVTGPWGKNADHLWIKEGVDMLSSLNSSVYLQDMSLNGRPDINNTVELGSGISTTTHSHLLESKYSISNSHTILYAHRLDFPDISNTMFSPRLSLVSNFDENNTLVSTAQRAQRMMPIRAQYLAYMSGDNSKLETLDSIELSYTNSGIENTKLNLRTYYNMTKAVGYTGQSLEFLTDFDLFGVVFSANYQYTNSEMIFNHAFLKPLNIIMNDELKTGQFRNNITFSDYYYQVNRGIPLTLEDYGNGLNNIPQNISKFIYSHYFMDERLKANINVQIYWDFQGSYDEMGMYQQAYENVNRNNLSPAEQILFDQQYQDFTHERQLLEATSAFEVDYNVNASLTYLWTTNDSTDIKLTLYAENMLNSSYRYYVSTGSSTTYPNRLSYLDKPVTFGLSVQVDFY